MLSIQSKELLKKTSHFASILIRLKRIPKAVIFKHTGETFTWNFQAESILIWNFQIGNLSQKNPKTEDVFLAVCLVCYEPNLVTPLLFKWHFENDAIFFFRNWLDRMPIGILPLCWVNIVDQCGTHHVDLLQSRLVYLRSFTTHFKWVTWRVCLACINSNGDSKLSKTNLFELKNGELQMAVCCHSNEWHSNRTGIRIPERIWKWKFDLVG